jgi:hypothetical protein
MRKERKREKKEERKKEETQNWIDEGMFIILNFSCFPETKKRRVRGAEDIFTSIITSRPFSFHEEFPYCHLEFTQTSPLMKKRGNLKK